MGKEETLLERLRNPRPDAPLTTRENTDRLAQSILQNVRKILNTKQEHAPIQSDYGIPDMTDLIHSFPESIREVQNAIRNTINKYEPRLRVINVKYLESEDDLLTLRFEIKAQLVTAKEKASLWFETLVDSSGEVQIRG